MSCASTLWMGDVEPYMDAMFISKAFQMMGENILGVKMIISKHTRTPASYCFVEFPDSSMAHKAMLRLNGKVIPGSSPIKRFKLNHASYGREHLLVPEYSLFVGDLSDDVDDLQLFTAFSKRYKSCRAAKVVTDNDGRTRGYGFVRFTEETEQQMALVEMNHYAGIGSKPIRVSLAAPKRTPPSVPGVPPPSGHYYHPYQQAYYNYNGWGTGYNYPSNHYYPYPSTGDVGYAQDQHQASQQNYEQQVMNEEDETLEDPMAEINVEVLNQEFIEQSEELYTALEGSRWHPLDNIMSPITPAVK